MSRMTDYADIACDVCNQWQPGVEPDTRAQRVVLRRLGWTTRFHEGRLQDLCPECTKNIKEKQS